MNARWYFNEETGLTAIRPHPDAKYNPSPEEVKAWHRTGLMPTAPHIEVLRCPTCGRASDCCCGPDCPYCVDGVPMLDKEAREGLNRGLIQALQNLDGGEES